MYPSRAHQGQTTLERHAMPCTCLCDGALQPSYARDWELTVAGIWTWAPSLNTKLQQLDALQEAYSDGMRGHR